MAGAGDMVGAGRGVKPTGKGYVAPALPNFDVEVGRQDLESCESPQHGRTPLVTAIMLLAGLAQLWAQSASVPRLFDVVISNGHIVDGTGSPWYSGDIGISRSEEHTSE